MYRSLTFYTNKKVVRVVGYPSARGIEKVKIVFFCMSATMLHIYDINNFLDIPHFMFHDTKRVSNAFNDVHSHHFIIYFDCMFLMDRVCGAGMGRSPCSLGHASRNVR